MCIKLHIFLNACLTEPKAHSVDVTAHSASKGRGTPISTMHLVLQSQPLTTDYGSSRPQSIVLTHSYSGGCIRLVALITHMGGHRYKLPPTVAGHIDNTIGYGNGGHSIMVLLTLGVIVTWRWPCHM